MCPVVWGTAVLTARCSVLHGGGSNVQIHAGAASFVAELLKHGEKKKKIVILKKNIKSLKTSVTPCGAEEKFYNMMTTGG